MAIRIGSTPPRRPSTKNLIPQTRGMSDVAQRKIDQLAVMAARRSVEAIRTDGWPVHLWVKNPQANQPCTCRGATVAEPETFTADDSLETATVGPNEGDDRPVVFEDTDIDSIFRVHWQGRGIDASRNVSSVPPALPTSEPLMTAGASTAEATELDGEIPSTDVIGPDPSDDPWEDTFRSLFPFLNDATPCTICGGTGKVDGLRWQGGIRYLLRAGVSSVRLNAAEVRQSTRPYTFALPKKTAYVEWDWTFPPYFEGVTAVRIRNNRETLPLDLEAYVGAAWVPFTTAQVTAFKGTGGTLTLRVKSSEFEEFTHVELFLATVQPPFAQFPQLQRDAGSDAIEALLTVDFEIDPEVGAVTRGSLIESPDHGRTFLVTSVMNKQTSRGFQFGCTGNVRVVQPMEALAAFGMSATSYGGHRDLPFRGSEPTIGTPAGTSDKATVYGSQPNTNLPSSNTVDKAG